ncbi:MAG TPA: hypothetical protein VGH20_18855 [Myxococcales bacterium]|jgi:hypothetical protein
MKRFGWTSLCLAVLACGKSGTTTSPYLVSTSVPDGNNPFLIAMVWEPAAGQVDRYSVEVKPAGGGFTDVGLLPQPLGQPPGNYLDLAQVVPNGGQVTLRVRADPGGFESNELTYDPGAPLSTVTVSPVPDPASHAFLVHYGNRTAPQVLLQRRTIDGGGATSGYVTIASGTGTDILFADTDITSWTDGMQFQYQAVSATPGARPTLPVATERAQVIAPEIVSYRPDLSGATIVVRNNSHFAIDFDVVSLLNGRFFTSVGFNSAPPGGVASVHYSEPIPFAEFKIEGSTAVASFSVEQFVALQSADALLQPVTRSMQFGNRAVRNAQGDFCIAEDILDSFQQLVGVSIFAAGDPADPLMVQTKVRLQCRADPAGRSHVIWFEPPATAGGLGQVMHASNGGGGWDTEVVATHPSVSAEASNLQEGSVSFAFGVDGTLFGAWFVDAQDIELATLVPGQPWTLQAVPAPPHFAEDPGHVLVAGDEAGAPHLLVSTIEGAAHIFQGASGWTTDAVSFPFDPISGVFEMSVAEGSVRFISREIFNNQLLLYVTQNASGWGAQQLPVTGANDIEHSADGRDFILLSGTSALIVRDGGAITTTPVSSSVFFGGDAGRAAAASVGFSANGNPWALEWLAPASPPTIAAPRADVPAFLFE